jgi:hypothetical protein
MTRSCLPMIHSQLASAPAPARDSGDPVPDPAAQHFRRQGSADTGPVGDQLPL